MSASAESLNIAGVTVCQISDYSVKLNRGLSPYFRQRHLRPYGHAERFLKDDHSHRIVFAVKKKKKIRD